MSRTSRLYSFCAETNGASCSRAGDPCGVGELPRGEVRAADVANLALRDEIVERPQRLLDGRARIGLVQLVEVDVVGAKSPQAVLDRLHDVAARRPALDVDVVHLPSELGREHDVAPARAEHFAELRFRAAAVAVRIRGVEKRHALVERTMHDAPRGFDVEARAEIVAAQSGDATRAGRCCRGCGSPSRISVAEYTRSVTHRARSHASR